MSDTTSQQPHGSDFREHLPDLSIPRFTTMKKQNAHEYAQAFKSSGQPPWLHGLYLHWRKLFEEPYKGVTNDGRVRDGLYQLQDEGVPIEAITSAANTVLDRLSESQRKMTCYHIDSPEWRSWSNPEFLLSDKGIRLDEITPCLREDVLKVLEATLSPEGYEKAIGAMRVNHFLGELVESPAITNEFSYNFVFFDSNDHLPWFTGAEPNLIDQGPYKGTRILNKEESLGLRLMQDLPKEQQTRAQVYKLMRDPAMPHGRWNHDDQRHLCGAYRDNRVVPYEGILVSEMTNAQQDVVLAIANEFFLYLPERARQFQLEQVKSFFYETYWCWIGGYGDEDPFYYRIQSPVIIVEFDHHSGVFLANSEPAKFHIHTLLRMPNGGDYGMALRPLIKGQEQGFIWEG